MKRVHYSWAVCIGCILMMIICSGMMVTGFTAFMPHIMAENGFSNTQVNLINTIRTLFGLVAKMGAVALIHKIEARRTALLSCLSATAAFLLFALSPNLFGYYCAAALAGLSNGLGSMILVTILLNRWFKLRLHLALALSSAGSAAAVTVLPPIITSIAEGLGLKIAFLAGALAVFVMAIVIFQLLRDDPQEKGLQPYGDMSQASSSALSPKARAVGAAPFSTVGFFVLCMAPFLIGASGTNCASFYALHCSGLGFPSMSAALATSVYGAAMLLGKALYGAVIELLGGKRTNLLFLLALIAGFWLSCFAGASIILLLLTSVLIGLGLSLCTVGISAWATDLVPPKDLDCTVGRFQIFYTLGMLIFSVVPGPIADRFGSYAPVFLLFGLMVFVVLLILQWAYRKNERAAQSAG